MAISFLFESEGLLLLHSLTTWGMAIVYWLVQRLIYPGFLVVDESRWQDHHNSHVKNITPIVAPLMILQLVSGIGLFFGSGEGLLLGFTLIQWSVTFIFIVPLHNHIGAQVKNDLAIQKLIRRNWYRTVLGSLHAALLFL